MTDGTGAWPAPDAWRPPMAADRLSRPPGGHVGRCIAGVVACGLSAAVAGWWLIGNLSEHERFPGSLDHDYRAPTVPHWVVRTFGPIAVVLVAVIAVWLIAASVRGLVDRRWVRVAGVLGGAGFLFAAIGRDESAGVVGATSVVASR